jgi:Peptidase inhibitor I78 family
MRMMRLVPALLVLLAACDDGLSTPAGDPPDMSVPEPWPCESVAEDRPFGESALVGAPASILDDETFPEGTRIFNTGDPLTRDFRADRLNIEIGPAGFIVAVTCG